MHASIRPASGGITFSADKPVSRTHTHTHTRLARPVHSPRKVIRDHGERVGHANVTGVPFRSTSSVPPPILTEKRRSFSEEKKEEVRRRRNE